MAKRPRLGFSLCVLAVWCAPLWAQVEPVPIPGGDIVPPLIHSFLPGSGTGFDGLNADPNGVTNFSGTVAMGYTTGTATDNFGNAYAIGTVIRVFQGNYVGVEGSVGGVGASKSAKSFGTFVLI